MRLSLSLFSSVFRAVRTRLYGAPETQPNELQAFFSDSRSGKSDKIEIRKPQKKRKVISVKKKGKGKGKKC